MGNLRELETLTISDNINGIHLLINLNELIIYECMENNTKIKRSIKKLKKINSKVVIKFI